MQYHSNAKTNVNQRQYIHESKKSSRTLAEEVKVSHVTCNKWKNAPQAKDQTSRPHTIHYALTKADERIIIAVRDKGFLLDDILDALEPYISGLKRSNLYRTLVRYKRNKLTTGQKRETKKFATYDPGFVHIDIFDLPKIKNRKYCCFLAVDRVTRLMFLQVYARKSKFEAADFLTKCLQFFPFRIHTILTDNGRQFRMKGQTSFGEKCKSKGLFETICDIAGIKYRHTKPFHPWTNGMAEIRVKMVKAHTTKVHRYKNVQEAIADIYRFQNVYNSSRKLKVLGRKTPLDVTTEWWYKKPKIFIFDPTQM